MSRRRLEQRLGPPHMDTFTGRKPVFVDDEKRRYFDVERRDAPETYDNMVGDVGFDPSTHRVLYVVIPRSRTRDFGTEFPEWRQGEVLYLDGSLFRIEDSEVTSRAVAILSLVRV